jgi:hypothetical protein
VKIRLSSLCVFIAAGWLALTSPLFGEGHSPLVSPGERVVFSFQMAGSEKEPGYIVYRYGVREKIELEYPRQKSGSWKLFSYSYYLRGGGAANAGLDLDALSFTNSGFTYTLYWDYSAEDDSTTVGIRVKNLKTGKEVDLPGVLSSVIGSLVDLREEPRLEAKPQE